MMAMLAAARRRLRLVPALIRDPGEFRALVSKDLEIWSDRLVTRAHPYDPVDWDTLADELGQMYPDTKVTLREAALESIEAEIKTAIAQRGTGGSRSQAYNTDFDLARCAYLICRLLRPTLVVETGVAHGLSSAFILQALAVNGHGTLQSLDLAPLGREFDHGVGGLIPNRLRGRWQLHAGSSRQKLAALLGVEAVDVFLHDSTHTYRTMSWEFATVWPCLRSGGVLLSDDIQNNKAFAELHERGVRFWRAVQERGKPFLFGIAVKR